MVVLRDAPLDRPWLSGKRDSVWDFAERVAGKSQLLVNLIGEMAERKNKLSVALGLITGLSPCGSKRLSGREILHFDIAMVGFGPIEAHSNEADVLRDATLSPSEASLRAAVTRSVMRDRFREVSQLKDEGFEKWRQNQRSGSMLT